MEVQLSTEPTLSVRQRLFRDHARLELLFENLLGSYEEEDWADVREAWTTFDEGLLRHMAVEEKYVLPLFVMVDPEEASSLRTEHDDIRRKLAAFGVQVDLHALSLDMAHAFVDELRAHARREDNLVYEWADRSLDEGARAEVMRGLDRLRA